MIARMATQTVARPPADPRRRRGATFWVGIALILAGLAVLAYVAWQFFGTNVVAHQKQQKIVEKTESAWRSQGSAGASGTAQGVELDGAQALVRIPRFGKGYVMPVQAGVSERVLAEGYGHFPRTADAGQVGNYAIAAHRVTHGEPLRDMPEAASRRHRPGRDPHGDVHLPARHRPEQADRDVRRRLGDRRAADEPARRRPAGPARRARG